MAGDWIKMRTDLAEDPAVIGMASALNLDEDVIVGKLHRLWLWADRQSRDGHASGVTQIWIDRYVRLDGFANAMVSVGWLSIDDHGIEFPNFDRHNGETSKKRALGTKRKQRQRSDVPHFVPELSREMSRTQRDKSETREEKRREERASSPVVPSKPKTGKLTFEAWSDQQTGDEIIPAGDPIFAWARDVGVPEDWLALAWQAFCDLYGKGGLREKKRYDDWRRVFRAAVKDDWLKVWRVLPDGRYVLTTVGEQLRRKIDASDQRDAA